MNESPEAKALGAAVTLGTTVAAFLDSPVGKYLVSRAESQRADALEELAEADPENTKEVRAIQTRIRVIDSIQQWLADAITGAQAAHQQLEILNSED